MTEKHLSHIPLIAVGTALCLGSLISVVYLSDPFTDGAMAHAFFYTSLFLTITGLFTVLGLVLRLKLGKGLYINNLAVSFRQAFLVGIFLIASLILLSQGLLFWWVELCLVLFLTFLELFLNL